MNSIYTLLPLLIIVFTALLLLICEVFIKREKKDYLAFIALFFLVLCFVVCVRFWDKEYFTFDGKLSLDNISLIFTFMMIFLTALVILISMKYISLQNANYGEYYSLLLFALSGMMIMVSSRDLLIIFLGLEVLSMSSYALAGLRRTDDKSVEAALKYFLLGSFASAFLVYGLALLYGAFQSTEIEVITNGFSSSGEFNIMALAGLGLLVVGFGFKIAVVPFHMWTPDVYEGAPTPITAFFSVGPKAVGFAVLLNLFLPYWAKALDPDIIRTALWIIAALTMIVGNLMALRQSNIKRILAYSSIAHAGYLLVAVLSADASGLIFYLIVYLFMNIGAFSAVIALGKKGTEYLELDDYAGVGFQYPWIGATFTVFLISLAGLPPTGGFLAKFYIFSSAVQQGMVPLVIIAVMASLISVFYYLRIVVYMYMRHPSQKIDIFMENPALFLVLFFCLYGVLQLGIFPGNILVVIRHAVNLLPF